MATTLSRGAAWDLFVVRLNAATVWLTSLACIAMPLSIAASQTLLAAALASLLLQREPLAFPRRLQIPVLGFACWTLLALALSPSPASGLPQIRKLFVFFVILLVANAFANQDQLWRAAKGVLASGALAALYGLGQFGRDYYRLTHQGLPFYENYVLHQITGFMSHWMTFSGQLMLLLLLLLSILLFANEGRGRFWGWLAAAVIGLALLGAFTRGIWLGTLAATTYLVTCYRRWMILLIPAALVLLYLVSPPWLQRRDQSLLEPAKDSSSMARIVMARAGLNMIAAHPVFGLGPERVGPEFARYAPPGEALPEAWYGHLHNSFLQLTAERGIPCLILLLWILCEVINYNIRQLKSTAAAPSAKTRAFSHAAIAATIGMIVSGLFEYNFGDSEVLMLYLFVISLPYAGSRAESQRHAVAASQILP